MATCFTVTLARFFALVNSPFSRVAQQEPGERQLVNDAEELVRFVWLFPRVEEG
jgi:hypothetical protein